MQHYQIFNNIIRIHESSSSTCKAVCSYLPHKHDIICLLTFERDTENFLTKTYTVYVIKIFHTLIMHINLKVLHEDLF